MGAGGTDGTISPERSRLSPDFQALDVDSSFAGRRVIIRNYLRLLLTRPRHIRLLVICTDEDMLDIGFKD